MTDAPRDDIRIALEWLYQAVSEGITDANYAAVTNAAQVLDLPTPLPSPQVSGEVVAWANPQEMRLWKTGKNRPVTLRQWQDGYCTEPLFASPLTNEPVVWGKVDADTGPNLSDQLAAIDAEPIVPVRDKPIRRFAGNEPVGVTVSFEDAALIVRALDDWEPGLANEEGAALRLMKELGGRNV